MDFFKLKSSLGSYYAEETVELCKLGYAAEFSSIGTMDFKWNKLEAEFYTDGKIEDIQLNGWTFSHRIEGHHRIYNQIGPDSPEFTIKGVDPNQHILEVKIYTLGFFKEAAADFMNNITLISKFPDRDSAMTFYKLLNWNRGSKTVDVLPLLKEMKSFYSFNHNSITDEMFWDRIKRCVDKVVEDYKKTFDTLKF